MTGIKGRRWGANVYVDDAIDVGAIPYKGANGQLLWLTPGASGKVIKSNGLTPSIPTYQDDDDSGGGGGGGFPFPYWHPEVQPGSPNALDEEWDGGPSISASYTALNAGTQTVDVNSRMTSALAVTTDGTTGWRGHVRNDQTIPAGDMSIAAHMGTAGMQADFTLTAFALLDGLLTSSNCLRVVLGYHSGFGSWGVYATTSSGISGGESILWGPAFIPSHEAIFRFSRVGSNYTVAYSHDGGFFHSSAAFTIGFTPTRWTTLHYCDRGTNFGIHYWKWIRYQAAAAARFGANL